MDSSLVNPFIAAKCNVFGVMLGCPIQQKSRALRKGNSPPFEINAIVCLTGLIRGCVLFSVPPAVALSVAGRMLGMKVDAIDEIVIDVVGELTNMIAGGAKAELSMHRLNIGLPRVVCGGRQEIHFPGGAQPVCIEFQTPWGPTAMEVGFETQRASMPTPPEPGFSMLRPQPVRSGER